MRPSDNIDKCPKAYPRGQIIHGIMSDGTATRPNESVSMPFGTHGPKHGEQAIINKLSGYEHSSPVHQQKNHYK